MFGMPEIGDMDQVRLEQHLVVDVVTHIDELVGGDPCRIRTDDLHLESMAMNTRCCG